jgi:hypothetical protein
MLNTVNISDPIEGKQLWNIYRNGELARTQVPHGKLIRDVLMRSMAGGSRQIGVLIDELEII